MACRQGCTVKMAQAASAQLEPVAACLQLFSRYCFRSAFTDRKLRLLRSHRLFVNGLRVFPKASASAPAESGPYRRQLCNGRAKHMADAAQLIVQVRGSEGVAGQHSVAAQVAALRQTVATNC